MGRRQRRSQADVLLYILEQTHFLSGQGFLRQSDVSGFQEVHSPHSVRLCGRNVLGLDATAAQTLGSLWGSLRGAGVELVLTGVRRASMLHLLQVSKAGQQEQH